MKEKQLEIALTNYIALKHNQDKCVGFIDGFKEALRVTDVSGSVCDYPWHDSEVVTFGGCTKCGEDLSK